MVFGGKPDDRKRTAAAVVAAVPTDDDLIKLDMGREKEWERDVMIMIRAVDGSQNPISKDFNWIRNEKGKMFSKSILSSFFSQHQVTHSFVLD